MASLWSTITTNSKLAIQAGTNFWDHLTNQNDGVGNGNGTIIVGATLDMNITNDLKMNIIETKLAMNLKDTISADLQQNALTANIDDTLTANIK